jgi:hypothetical protein
MGKTVPGSNRMTACSTTTHVAFVSKKSFLRGWLAGEVLLPLVDLDLQLVSGTESRVRGFAGLTVGAGLQWAPKKIGHRMESLDRSLRKMIQNPRWIPQRRSRIEVADTPTSIIAR